MCCAGQASEQHANQFLRRLSYRSAGCRLRLGFPSPPLPRGRGALKGSAGWPLRSRSAGEAAGCQLGVCAATKTVK